MPFALVSDSHGNDRAFAAVCLGDVNPGSVGVSDDGLAQFAIVTGSSVTFKRVPWNAS
ncbi:MAG TPA: hypothetical protein VFW41_00365 [Gaiellaceae bacterium]|nr:hypothetical protein [Gaiellaceae bacterium]